MKIRASKVAMVCVLSSALAFTPSAAQLPNSAGPAQGSPQPAAVTGAVRVDTVASGLANPWALEFLPDGRILVTEKGSTPRGRGGATPPSPLPAQLRIVSANGQLSAPLTGLPPIDTRGQGGLLDVALDPQFATNRMIYFSFSDPGEEGTNGTSVARARLGETALENVQIIYRQQPKVTSTGHFGSRLVFSRDGLLFVTQGDRQQDRFRDQAQQLSNGFGKVMRINPDGSIPRDNPFVGRDTVRPEIWSYGHRNVQGAALHPETGELWTVEHGPQGGDELNRPERGKNYGWPVILYGVNYGGAPIGEGRAKTGMEQPVYYWDPVIAPGGMTFYTGDAFPDWKGDLFIGGMSTTMLVRLELDNGRVVKEERYLKELGKRIRDVKQGPDGFLYVVTDDRNGQVLRVRPPGR